ncbi:hypothetical protein [Ignatzschineria sp. LJL83]
MAFYIEITKIAEDRKSVRYQFKSDNHIGEYVIHKENYKVIITKEIPHDRHGAISQRAIMKVLITHKRDRVWVEYTDWAS